MKKITTIFICVDWFYPAYKAGGPVQSIANMIEQFKEEAVVFRVFCSDKDADGTKLDITCDKWTVYNNNTHVWYASEATQKRKTIQAEIVKCHPDILFINGIYSWYFNLIPLLFGRAASKIISARGMLHPGALSQKSFKKKWYLKLWRLFNFDKGCTFHACDEAEKNYIHQVFGNKKQVYIAANFPKILPYAAVPDKKWGTLTLVSVALISAMKNHLLVLQALKNCAQQIIYNIFGPVKDAQYWQKCLEEIKELPENIRVNYLGDINPLKVSTVLKEAHVFILPSKSENYGHAIIEALFSGRPVITSNNTPWNNLQDEHAGINVNPDDINGLIDSITHFAIMSNAELNEWSIAANRYAEKNVHISLIKQQYQQMFALNL